ncbi:hypothetical protein AgCh_022431 [Apium graveolens]
MSLNKYESIKIPILKKVEYPTWKVKMLIHLEATDPDYLDLKEKTEWTLEEKVIVLKDAKVRYILHNSLDSVMSNMVLAYKTAKEIWDALETQCQGTMAIKKNRRVVQIQEYEHFEVKPDESLTDIYDRFLTLLNNLSLVGKQRKERKSNKGRSVALKVNAKASKERFVEAARKKNNLPESDTDDSSSNPDDDTDSETDKNVTSPDVMQMAAFLVKGFKKMQFRKSQKKKSFRKKFTEGERKSFGRREGKDSKAGKVDRSKIKCYNCDEPDHFATECKKTKHGKGKNKALITSSKDWIDSLDSGNEETCYALMARFDAPTSSDSKVSTSFFSFDIEDISELKSILKSLHGNFKNKILENNRLLTENEILKSRNDQLESNLVNQIEIQKECEKAKHTVKILKAKYSMLDNELENERKTLKAWTNSRKKVHEMISKKNWKECLGYVDGIKDVDTENKTTLKTLVMFISSEADEPKSIFEKGSTSASQEKSVSDKSQREEYKETIKIVKKEKNIGLSLTEK